jgi:hypothetical protein
LNAQVRRRPWWPGSKLLSQHVLPASDEPSAARLAGGSAHDLGADHRAAWLAISAFAALAIARAIHVADEKQRHSPEPLLLPEGDGHMPLLSAEEALAVGEATEPAASDGGMKRGPAPRGRRSVVRNPVAPSERTPHTHKSGAA